FGDQEFFTFILPVAHGVTAPEISEVPATTGRAFVIKYAGYTDAFVFNDEAKKTVETGVFDSDFKYSWARLREGENIPDEFVLIDGSRLTVAGGVEVFDVGDLAHVAVRRVGDELYVKSEKWRAKKFFP